MRVCPKAQPDVVEESLDNNRDSIAKHIAVLRRSDAPVVRQAVAHVEEVLTWEVTTLIERLNTDTLKDINVFCTGGGGRAYKCKAISQAAYASDIANVRALSIALGNVQHLMQLSIELCLMNGSSRSARHSGSTVEWSSVQDLIVETLERRARDSAGPSAAASSSASRAG